MTPAQRDAIRAAAEAEAAAAPPLTPAQRDTVNALCRDAVRAVSRG